MLSKKLSKINPIFILLLGIAIGFLGELMPDEIKDDLTANIEKFLPLTFRSCLETQDLTNLRRMRRVIAM